MSYFYHSAYTSEGFKAIKLNSYNPDCFRYIIKGHSDTVKENLIKKIRDRLISEGCDFSLSRNYSDRLTGIKCEQRGFIVCDGAPPFDESVSTFGATDGLIALENFQDGDKIRQNSDTVVSLLRNIGDCERRCCRFLNAAAGIKRDERRLEKDNTDSRKISRYTSKLWNTYGCLPSGKVGVEKNVFSGVPTLSGIKFTGSAIEKYCDTAVEIDDSAGYCRESILDRVRRYALSNGVDIISGRSFLYFDEAPDFVIMPALKFGVFAKIPNTVPDISIVKKVRAKRFELKKVSESTKVRMQFNRRAFDSLMKEVSASLKSIDFYKAELDKIFSDATDETKLCDYVLSKIFF